MRRLVLALVVLLGSLVAAFSEPAQSEPSTAKAQTPSGPSKAANDCGAPCAAAEKFLCCKEWDYRKAAKLYKQACKADQSGPAEACRLLALAGFETRGITLKKPVVLAMLAKTCKRGDAPSCAWAVYLASKRRVPPSELAMVHDACVKGDRASCEPLLTAISAQVSAGARCEPEWWTLAHNSCMAGDVDGCITYREMLFKEHDCKRPAKVRTVEELSDDIAKYCLLGVPDACLDISPNDQLLWEARCKAGEQFACEAFR